MEPIVNLLFNIFIFYLWMDGWILVYSLIFFYMWVDGRDGRISECTCRGNTFLSFTKVKVKVDIEFNIYLKFDMHLK